MAPKELLAATILELMEQIKSEHCCYRAYEARKYPLITKKGKSVYQKFVLGGKITGPLWDYMVQFHEMFYGFYKIESEDDVAEAFCNLYENVYGLD